MSESDPRSSLVSLEITIEETGVSGSIQPEGARFAG